MSHGSLILAWEGRVSMPIARWLTPLRALWPGGGAPTIEPCGCERLLSSLEDASGARSAAMPSAAIVVLGPDVPARLVDRLVEACHARLVPAVILVENADHWRSVQNRGVIFMDHEADPIVVASMACALWERQGVVELLSREANVAQRAALTLRREMDRLHEELHLAAAIQRDSTMTALPDVPGMRFAVLFRPMGFVSGDIYSLRPLPRGQVSFLVGDAVGHGVPAALLTMTLTNALGTAEAVAVAEGRIPRPSEVLAALNARLCETGATMGRFATAVYGVVDPASRRITLAGAGHPSPLLTASHSSRAIRSGGPLLGVFPDADFPEEAIELAPGQTLMIYTDGLQTLLEHEHDGDASLAGDCERRLTAMARQEGGVDAVIAGLHAAIDSEAGSLHQPDDITLLALSALPLAASSPRARAA